MPAATEKTKRHVATAMRTLGGSREAGRDNAYPDCAGVRGLLTEVQQQLEADRAGLLCDLARTEAAEELVAIALQELAAASPQAEADADLHPIKARNSLTRAIELLEEAVARLG
jgi:hypothetical protein